MHKTQQQQQHKLSSEIRSAIEKEQTPCENEKSRVSKTQQSTTIAPRACSFVASMQKGKERNVNISHQHHHHQMRKPRKMQPSNTPPSNFRKRFPFPTREKGNPCRSEIREVDIFFRAHERPALDHGRKTVRSMRFVGLFQQRQNNTTPKPPITHSLSHKPSVRQGKHACHAIYITAHAP
jgi:hypothetical protein